LSKPVPFDELRAHAGLRAHVRSRLLTAGSGPSLS
jgi:hypothetical protein